MAKTETPNCFTLFTSPDPSHKQTSPAVETLHNDILASISYNWATDFRQVLQAHIEHDWIGTDMNMKEIG